MLRRKFPHCGKQFTIRQKVLLMISAALRCLINLKVRANERFELWTEDRCFAGATDDGQDSMPSCRLNFRHRTCWSTVLNFNHMITQLAVRDTELCRKIGFHLRNTFQALAMHRMVLDVTI